MQVVEAIEVKHLKAYDDSKLFSTMFTGNMKSNMKTWYPIRTRPLSWQRGLKTSTSTMYRVSKMHIQTHWHPSTYHWPFHLETPRKYSFIVATYIAANLSLKTVKLQEEQVKEVLETSTSIEPSDWRFPSIDFILYGILPDGTKEEATIRRKTLDSITMGLCRYYIITIWWNLALMPFTQRGTWSTQRSSLWYMQSSPTQTSETGSEDLAIIGRRWSLTPSLMLSDVHQALRRLHPTSSSWPFEMWGMDVIGPISPPIFRGHRFILAIMGYFFK